MYLPVCGNDGIREDLLFRFLVTLHSISARATLVLLPLATHCELLVLGVNSLAI